MQWRSHDEAKDRLERGASHSTLQATRNELLKHQQLFTLLRVDRRRPSFIDCSSDLFVGFGLFQAS